MASEYKLPVSSPKLFCKHGAFRSASTEPDWWICEHQAREIFGIPFDAKVIQFHAYETPGYGTIRIKMGSDRCVYASNFISTLVGWNSFYVVARTFEVLKKLAGRRKVWHVSCQSWAHSGEVG